ncbi:YraN family protein [Mycetocola tolaasinivorans]|uniref:UPF0102 protein D9V32_11505 n=1 Tax=Mycetocola tolaasinivorans TaxID=76635 RepID=A0A3L7A417_9MICO|nr:YraN family protein [Mycetocola tolaasinivorans]RLP75039.1 YraN family protein [Mycetocola tolaasinivorans]
MANQDVGRDGENLAVEYLSAHGFEIVERNWRCIAGEVDIIARDGTTGVIAMVEVKTRRGLLAGHPFEAITAKKLARMNAVGVHWREQAGLHERVQLDVIGIILRGAGPAEIEHLRDIS